MSNLEIVLVALCGALLILLALSLLGIGRTVTTGPKTSPTAAAVFTALEPYLFKAILAGERAVIWSMEAARIKLEGADKKLVADSVYALLPPSIVVDGVTLPLEEIKLLVPPDKFEGWVKQAYDEADAFLSREEDYLRSQVDALKPPAAPAG